MERQLHSSQQKQDQYQFFFFENKFKKKYLIQIFQEKEIRTVFALTSGRNGINNLTTSKCPLDAAK